MEQMGRQFPWCPVVMAGLRRGGWETTDSGLPELGHRRAMSRTPVFVVLVLVVLVLAVATTGGRRAGADEPQSAQALLADNSPAPIAAPRMASASVQMSVADMCVPRSTSSAPARGRARVA